jgi:hypothetical protein
VSARDFAFVLCDQSTLTDDAHGGPLTTAILDQIGAAVAKQMNGEVAAEWGCNVTFRTGAADASDVKPGEIACLIQDNLPQAPGAAAFHDRLPNGCPVAYFAREDYTSHTQGSSSLSVDVSHEAIETIGDPGANRWADLASGTQDCALELCDPVQNQVYEVDGIAVSDFVLQSFFDPGASGPFDRLGKCPAQGDYSGGYLIVRTEAAQPSDVGAKRAVRVLGARPTKQRGRVKGARPSRRGA